MKPVVKKSIFVLVFMLASFFSYSQCEILNRVSPDGSMYYYIEPVNFYWTKSKSLKGGIVTDKENYFLELNPVPFPEKPEGNKLKKDLELKLSNGQTYILQHYDTRYVKKDTVIEMLYLIDNKDIEFLKNYEVVQATIDMLGEEGIRTYVFKLHKTALMEQLECLMKEDEHKKKK